jgi:hypothetical protein
MTTSCGPEGPNFEIADQKIEDHNKRFDENIDKKP